MENKNRKIEPHLKLASLTYLCVFALAFSGCTNANIQVKSSVLSTSFSLTSKSPFEAENEMFGGNLQVSGACKKTVTTIQVQLDNFGWVDVQKSKPAPIYANLEYLANGDVYDVDCSDGKFSFYIFYNQLLTLYASKGVAIPGEFEPSQMRFQGLDSESKLVGAAGFDRGRVEKFEISEYSGTNPSPPFTTNLGPGVSRKYKLSLQNGQGRRATSPTAMSFIVKIADNTPNDLKIYSTTSGSCDTPLDAVVNNKLTLPANKDEIEFCVRYDNGYLNNSIGASYSSLSTGNRPMLVTETSEALPSFTKQISIKSNSEYFVDIRYGDMKMIRGLDYPIKFEYRKYDGTSYPSNFVSRLILQGGLTNSTDLVFSACNTFSSCTNSASNEHTVNMTSNAFGSIAVRSASGIAEARINIDGSMGGSVHADTNFTLTFDSDSSQAYDKPYLLTQDNSSSLRYNKPMIGQKLNECRYYDVVRGNSNGAALPAIAATISLSADGGGFYTNWDCSTTATSVTLAVGNLPTVGMYYKSPATMNPNGYNTITLSDGLKSNAVRIYTKQH